MSYYGVGAQSQESPALVGGHPRLLKGGVIVSGNTVKRGQVLAMTSAGRWVPLALEVAVADEVVAAGDGSTKEFKAHLANQGVVKGSLIIKATVGALAKQMADATGRLLGAGVGLGMIHHDPGYLHLVYSTAPDDETNVTADYSHDAAGQAVAAGIVWEDVDASTADATGQILLMGDVMSEGLIWPDDITEGQTHRAYEQLQARGIVIHASLVD